jgi:hypothetical protein
MLERPFLKKIAILSPFVQYNQLTYKTVEQLALYFTIHINSLYYQPNKIS